VIAQADFTGSTAEIINEVLNSGADEFIIGTETGVIEHLAGLAPEKSFYPLTNNFECEDMKKTCLSDVLYSLETGNHEMKLNMDDAAAARQSLERMVSV